MDEYQKFVEAEKTRERGKAQRGRLSPEVEELIGRAIAYAEKHDGIKLVRKQVIELAVLDYWKRKLDEQDG